MAERLQWPVLVDELDGTVHRAYGMLPNSVFLIDVDGLVSFRGDFSHGATLRSALNHLFEQGGRGIVSEGGDKIMHPIGPTAFGWQAIRRSGRAAVRDVVRGMPPLAANLWMGDKVEPLLAPLARRSRPLPAAARVALGVAAAGAMVFAWKALRSDTGAE